MENRCDCVPVHKVRDAYSVLFPFKPQPCAKGRETEMHGKQGEKKTDEVQSS